MTNFSNDLHVQHFIIFNLQNGYHLHRSTTALTVQTLPTAAEASGFHTFLSTTSAPRFLFHGTG